MLKHKIIKVLKKISDICYILLGDVMSNEFNINNINRYKEKRDGYLSSHVQYPKTRSFNLNAVFSLFDKNHDGKISRNEFNQVSKDDYSNYVEQLKDYNVKNGNGADNNSIWSHEQIANSLDDGFFTSDEAEEVFSETKSENSNFKGASGFEEKRNLKDASQMSRDEMAEELQSYGINTENLSDIKIQRTLVAARQERAKSDLGSDEVDGHIGTYAQGKSKYCSVLAQLDSFSDEDVANMFTHNPKEPKIDSEGKKYWEVKFPCDEDNDRTVIITENELNNKAIIVEENGAQREVADFPEGDNDVTLLTMAFVKRFGTRISDKGAWAFQTKNKFTPSSQEQYVDNQHLEDFTVYDFKNMPPYSQVNILSKDELAKKGIDISGENMDLSWVSKKQQSELAEIWGTYELSNGLKMCIGKCGVMLSDGTKISVGHALSYRGFDEKTNELIVSQNEYNNLSELRIPMELAPFLETASKPNAPGVDKTPTPDVQE